MAQFIGIRVIKDTTGYVAQLRMRHDDPWFLFRDEGDAIFHAEVAFTVVGKPGQEFADVQAAARKECRKVGIPIDEIHAHRMILGS